MSSKHFPALTLARQAGKLRAMKVNSMREMRAVWKRAGQNGGKRRDELLSRKRKSEIARQGGLARAAKRKAARKDFRLTW